MRLSTGTQSNSSASLRGLVVTTSGSGPATVIITGEVVDGNGKQIGDLHTLLEEALTAWEGLLDSISPGWGE